MHSSLPHFFYFLFFVSQVKPEPISIYHPTAEEISSSMGTPMEGFYDGANVVFEAATPATPAVAPRVSAEAPVPSTKPIPIDKGTHTKRVSETAPIPAETLTPQEGAIPLVVAQTEVASLATPLVISTSDPFAALSQTVKDGSSLVVTPSSIPSFATHGPDADLSFEGSEDVLEDPDDEPTIKKRVSDSNEEESADHEAKFMGMCLLILLSSFLPPFFLLLLPSLFFFFLFSFSSLYTYIYVTL